MSSATDELRRLLDECGVDYETYDPPYPEFSTPTSDITTRWGNASYREWPNGTIRFSARGTTPEQAIAATLGPGTCHMERDFRRWDDDLGWLTSYTCSVCGEPVILMSDRKPSCCPSCNRKVVEE